jgi:hypothetical protein
VKPALLLHAAAAMTIIGAFNGACAQEIHLYSEFQRFDPFGQPVAADRALAPREILSPAMARNGHLSLHVVVTGASGTNYFLYVGSNPPDILQVKLYREYFAPCGDDFCPDWLAEQTSPAFGVIPEFRHDVARPAMEKQTTRCYLLDIWAPPGTPPRRVRVEALLKTGTWQVAPLEVRIEAPIVPDLKDIHIAEDIAPIEAASSITAQIQLLRYLTGLPAEFPPRMVRVRDVIQRNAAEDALLARSFQASRGAPDPLPDLNLLSWWPVLYPLTGAEWYLKVRDFLYRFGA